MMTDTNKNLLIWMNYPVIKYPKIIAMFEVGMKMQITIIGKVDHLLVNKTAEQVYLDVEVDKTVVRKGTRPMINMCAGVHEFLNKEGENHLFTIGMVNIDQKNKLVNKIDSSTFAKAKRFKRRCYRF
jgi:hypothetical protein